MSSNLGQHMRAHMGMQNVCVVNKTLNDRAGDLKEETTHLLEEKRTEVLHVMLQCIFCTANTVTQLPHGPLMCPCQGLCEGLIKHNAALKSPYRGLGSCQGICARAQP